MDLWRRPKQAFNQRRGWPFLWWGVLAIIVTGAGIIIEDRVAAWVNKQIDIKGPEAITKVEQYLDSLWFEVSLYSFVAFILVAVFLVVLFRVTKTVQVGDGVALDMELEESAEALKRAELIESEAARQSQINRAEGEKQAAILIAEGERQSNILRAEGEQQASALRAQGLQEQAQKFDDARSAPLSYAQRRTTIDGLGESLAIGVKYRNGEIMPTDNELKS